MFSKQISISEITYSTITTQHKIVRFKIFGYCLYSSNKYYQGTDARPIAKDKPEYPVQHVQCDICNNEWDASFNPTLDKLECPRCHQMTDYQILEQ